MQRTHCRLARVRALSTECGGARMRARARARRSRTVTKALPGFGAMSPASGDGEGTVRTLGLVGIAVERGCFCSEEGFYAGAMHAMSTLWRA